MTYDSTVILDDNATPYFLKTSSFESPRVQKAVDMGLVNSSGHLAYLEKEFIWVINTSKNMGEVNDSGTPLEFTLAGKHSYTNSTIYTCHDHCYYQKQAGMFIVNVTVPKSQHVFTEGVHKLLQQPDNIMLLSEIVTAINNESGVILLGLQLGE
jgi:hypothetical protein